MIYTDSARFRAGTMHAASSTCLPCSSLSAAALFFYPSRVPLSVSLAIVSPWPGHEQWLRNSKTYLVEFTRYHGRRASDWHFSKHRPGKWNSVIESSAFIRPGCGARSMAGSWTRRNKRRWINTGFERFLGRSCLSVINDTFDQVLWELE